MEDSIQERSNKREVPNRRWNWLARMEVIFSPFRSLDHNVHCVEKRCAKFWKGCLLFGPFSLFSDGGSFD